MNKVLLIDDDKDDAQFFREALWEVMPSASFSWADGCDAIDYLIGKKIPFPDIIF